MSLRGVRERRRWRFDAFLGCDFQRSLERQLDLARCFLTGGSVRHDPAPFNDLGDEAFVAFLRRIPNADFIISGIRLHQCFSSWFEIQFLQLVPYLPYLIRFRLSAGAGLQIQEARPSVKNDMAAFRLARIVTELRQKGAEIIKGKIRVVSTSRQLVEQFFRPCSCAANCTGTAAGGREAFHLVERPLSHSLRRDCLEVRLGATPRPSRRGDCSPGDARSYATRFAADPFDKLRAGSARAYNNVLA